MKRLISLALVLIMSVGLLTGCGNSATGTPAANETTASDTKVLLHTYSTDPYVTLDPSSEYSNGVMVLQNVYETLTRYNAETGEIDPLLATEWSSNEDGTVWVFKLREDVTFHDGSQMTAAQVVNSFKRTMKIGQGGCIHF